MADVVDRVYEHMRAAYDADQSRPHVGRDYVRRVLAAAIQTLGPSQVDPNGVWLHVPTICGTMRPTSSPLLAGTVIDAWREVAAQSKPAPTEPVVSIPDTDVPDEVYLAAARAGAGPLADRGPVAGTPQRIANEPGFRLAVDEVWRAAQAPLLAELAEARADVAGLVASAEHMASESARVMRIYIGERDQARAEVEQFHARLAADGFVAFTREQVETWRTCEAERDQARASLAGAVAANDALATENAEVHTALTDMAHVATCGQAGCAEPAHTTEVGRAGDRLAADIDRLVAEVDGLRAATLPEGGKWVTDYGHDPAQVAAHGIEWHPGLHCVRDTYRRRVWYGPVEPVDETEAAGG